MLLTTVATLIEINLRAMILSERTYFIHIFLIGEIAV